MSSQSDTSEQDTAEEMIQADFAFFDPKPNDFHGVKSLLQRYLDDKQWDLSAFVDIILAQTTVGSVVKIKDDEDEGLFAILTALNMGRYKDHNCFAELKDYLLKVCEEESLCGNLRILLEDQAEHVGLVVLSGSQIFLLSSCHIYMMAFLMKYPGRQKMSQVRISVDRFASHIIYWLPEYTRKSSLSSTDADLIYVNAKDEIFHELCSWSFNFSLRSHQPAEQELKGYQMMGLVMAVEANKAPTFRQKLRSLIDDS